MTGSTGVWVDSWQVEFGLEVGVRDEKNVVSVCMHTAAVTI